MIKSLLKKAYETCPHSINRKELVWVNRINNKYLKLRSKYIKYVDTNIHTVDKASDYVWICWFQGIDNAPAIVKSCVNSVYKQFHDKQVVLITSDNFAQYTNIPQYIIDKWNYGKGCISNTHFSDILRAELLATHGGLWIDATVLCTGNLDKYITPDADLFVYRNEYRNDYSSVASSWLIYAKPNNPIITNTRNLLYRYWRKSNKLFDYFLFHMFFAISCEVFHDEWDAVPAFTNIDPHLILFYELYKPFNKARFEQIKAMTNFHKLSYKVAPGRIVAGSYFDIIAQEKY